jgi:hypothetical protein
VTAMTVNLTTNLGLRKPTQDEIARLWEADDLSEDNNSDFNAAKPNDLSYSANGFIGGSQINFGTGGTLNHGLYVRMPGDFIFGWFVRVFGSSGVSVPAGDAILIELPVPADTTFHNESAIENGIVGTFDIIGEGFVRDNSDVANSMLFALDLVHISGVSYARPCTESYTGKTQRFLDTADPVAWAASDSITGNFFYKAA